MNILMPAKLSLHELCNNTSYQTIICGFNIFPDPKQNQNKNIFYTQHSCLHCPPSFVEKLNHILYTAISVFKLLSLKGFAPRDQIK